MSATDRTRSREDPVPDTGERRKTVTRSITKMNGSENCLGINLTEPGTVILGVEAQDEQPLVIYENGIWIPKHD